MNASYGAGDPLLSGWVLGGDHVAGKPAIEWLFINAYWTGDSRDACLLEGGKRGEGACWIYIQVWFNQLMYGRFPPDEQWRINLTYFIGIAGLAWLIWPRLPHKGWVAVFMLFVFPILCLYMYAGGAFGLAPDLISRCDLTLSLSSLTFPHDMARLVLAEQLYRAGTILRNEPYHKGAE